MFADVFKWLYRKFHNWMEKRKNKNTENLSNQLQYLCEEEKVLLPSTACLLVLVIYVVIGDG